MPPRPRRLHVYLPPTWDVPAPGRLAVPPGLTPSRRAARPPLRARYIRTLTCAVPRQVHRRYTRGTRRGSGNGTSCNNRLVLPASNCSGDRVKKGPKNPISLVDGKPSSTRNRAAYDRSFNQHDALPAGRHARTGLPAGRGRWHDGGAHLRGARHRAPRGARPADGPPQGPPLSGRAGTGRIDPWLRAGCQARPRAGRLDAAGGAERPSTRTHGRAAPGNANRSRPAPRHPGRRLRYRG